ncbi:MAG: hypothetical protein EBZ48_15630, partial [Proteobacteria bacterium]|nr:hypothetical protein [Pseudomonadota bacterium]
MTTSSHGRPSSTAIQCSATAVETPSERPVTGQIELLIAALVTPAAPESLEQILQQIPPTQRAEVVRKSLVQLAISRVTIAEALQLCTEDLTAVRARGFAPELLQVISGQGRDLIPSEIRARERALTEVTAIIHVAYGRELGVTQRIVTLLTHHGISRDRSSARHKPRDAESSDTQPLIPRQGIIRRVRGPGLNAEQAITLRHRASHFRSHRIQIRRPVIALHPLGQKRAILRGRGNFRRLEWQVGSN